MLGFSPKLPVNDVERQWVDLGFSRLEKMLGKSRLIKASVIVPTDEYFPDPYDAKPAAAEMLFRRVCNYMQVDRGRIELEIFTDESEELRELLPFWSGKSDGCAGLFHHAKSGGEEEKQSGKANDAMVIALKRSLLKDPLPLIATIAHELGHVILLGGGLMDPDAPDHEPMTDLLTVFLGLGIFTANSAFRFRQYQDVGKHGWSMARLGYLREEIYGYALARFAAERGEHKPAWTRHLSTNVRAYYKRSEAWLAKNFDPIKTPLG